MMESFIDGFLQSWTPIIRILSFIINWTTLGYILGVVSIFFAFIIVCFIIIVVIGVVSEAFSYWLEGIK